MITISKFLGDAMIDLWSAIFSAATINVMDSSGVLLVSFQLPAVPFRDSEKGETNLREQIFARAVENGFAAKFNVTKADGNLLYEGAVGTGSGELNINSTQIIKGGEVILNSFKQYVEVG